MKGKKNKVNAFLCSLIPGAGHMYIGFMKQGVSLMILFLFPILLEVYLGLSNMTLFLPIIWFYSFFDLHNKRALDDREIQNLEDKYIFSGFESDEIIHQMKGKLRPIFAIVFVLLGSYSIYDIIMDIFPKWLKYNYSYTYEYDLFYLILTRLPHLLIAFVIIYLGYYLIRGKKRELLSLNGSEHASTVEHTEYMTEVNVVRINEIEEIEKIKEVTEVAEEDKWKDK